MLFVNIKKILRHSLWVEGLIGKSLHIGKSRSYLSAERKVWAWNKGFHGLGWGWRRGTRFNWDQNLKK